MPDLKVGDIVGRMSYGCDVFFKVVDVKDEGDQCIVTLQGIDYRLEADAPLSDLELQDEEKINEYRTKSLQQNPLPEISLEADTTTERSVETLEETFEETFEETLEENSAELPEPVDEQLLAASDE